MLDQLTPTRPSTSGAPLLGTAPGNLALLVCSGTHRGRVIQVRSPKCTIGSAVGCTLRLRAAGVRPLHCWILRGVAGTVVRRRAAGTLLNGQAYEDAPLSRGDRLRIGSVELEVVECPARQAEAEVHALTSVTQRIPAADDTANLDKIRELETCLSAANEENARLEADAQQAWQTSITAAERAEQLRVALEQANVEVGEVRAELEAAHAAQVSDHQLGRVEDLQNDLAESERKLAASDELLIRSQRELDEQASRFTSERDELQRQLSSVQNELEQTRAQAGQQSSQMTVTMDQVRAATQAEQAKEWEGRCANLEEELVALKAQLAAACIDRDAANQARGAAWHERDAANEQRDAACRERDAACRARDAANQEWERACRERDAAGQWEIRFREAEGQVEHWQAQAHGRQAQLEELQQQLAAEQSRPAQVDSATLEQMEQQQRVLEQLGSGLSAREEQLNAAHRGLAEFENELKRGREALDAERAEQQSVLDEQAADLQRQAQQLSQQTAELAGRQVEMSQAREQFATERAQVLAKGEEMLRVAAGQQAVIELSREEHISDPLDAVQSRVTQLGPWRTDAQSAEPPAEAALDDATEMPAADEPQPVANGPTIDAPAPQEEEPIETYMDRLMQRVRGDATDSPRTTLAALHEVLKKDAQQKSAPAALPEPLESQSSVEQRVASAQDLPRRQSADQRSDNKLVAGRLFVAGIVLLGSALLACCAWQIGSIPGTICAGIGLLIGSFWALRGFSRLLNSLKLVRPHVRPAQAAAEHSLPAGATAEATAEASAQ